MADKTVNGKAPKLVVLQLTGANDYLNTVVPYTNPLYYDNRPNMHIPAEQVQPIDATLGFNPHMQAVKRLYDEGKVAIIHSIGYPNPNYSHFRSMDIWYTCEPEKVSSEGWLGKVVRDLDPKGDNVLTAVNFGRGLPRALSLSGVPVANSIPMVFSLACRVQHGPWRWRPSYACTAAPKVAMKCCAIWVRQGWMRKRGQISCVQPRINTSRR